MFPVGWSERVGDRALRVFLTLSKFLEPSLGTFAGKGIPGLVSPPAQLSVQVWAGIRSIWACACPGPALGPGSWLGPRDRVLCFARDHLAPSDQALRRPRGPWCQELGPGCWGSGREDTHPESGGKEPLCWATALLRSQRESPQRCPMARHTMTPLSTAVIFRRKEAGVKCSLSQSFFC